MTDKNNVVLAMVTEIKRWTRGRATAASADTIWLCAQIERDQARIAELEADVARLDEIETAAFLRGQNVITRYGLMRADLSRVVAKELGVTFNAAHSAIHKAFNSLGISATPSQQQAPEADFQSRVSLWMQACFGPEISRDKTERNHRFLEEALELVQSNGCTQSEAHQLVDYVFGRPVGETFQEVGGVMVTLAALCSASDLNMAECGEKELARIRTKVEAIRAKHAAKPKYSPLPQQAPEAAAPSVSAAERAAECRREGRRIYNAERAQRSVAACEDAAFAAALTAEREAGRLAGNKEAMSFIQPQFEALTMAIRLLRDAAEELAPAGAVPSRDVGPPDPLKDAEEILTGFQAIAEAAKLEGIEAGRLAGIAEAEHAALVVMDSGNGPEDVKSIAVWINAILTTVIAIRALATKSLPQPEQEDNKSARNDRGNLNGY